MSSSSKKFRSSEDVEKRNSTTTIRKEKIQKNEEETSQCFQAMKLPMKLRIWPIFNLLKPEFIPQICLVMVYGSLGNKAIIVTKDKNVYNLGCTEDNSRTGDIQTTLCPKKIKELCGKNIKTFACSDTFILALTEEGEVYFWEFIKKSGVQVQEEFRFTRVAGLNEKRIVDIACGSSHSLALTSDGKVYAWGQNNYGQIGIEYSNFYSEPKQIKYELEEKKVVRIACGSRFNIVMTDKNKLYNWGNNEYGQISIDTQSAPRSSFGSTSNNIIINIPSQKSVIHPCEITTISDEIVKLACGYRHTLALSTKGKIYAWGNNNYGQLGVNNGRKPSVPIMVKTLQMRKMLDIAAYGNLSVAVEYDNIIYVWGDCGFGQYITTPFRTTFSTIHEPFAYNSCRVMHKPLTVCPNIYDDEEELNILESLEAAFDDPSTCDCTISVEGQRIHVHKNILKIRCQEFKNMFQCNCIENDQTTSSSSSLTIDKFSYIVYKAFLKYLYTDTVDISLEKIIELMELADMYGKTNLKKNCIQIIKQNITVSNVAFFYNKAKKYNAKELEEFCFQFMCHSYTAVTSSKEYGKLDKNTILDFTRKAAKEGVFKT